MPKDREASDGITDLIICLSQGFETDEILRGECQRRVVHIGDVAHPAKPHIRGPGEETRRQGPRICLLFGIASEDVIEGVHEPAVFLNKMYYAADVHLGEDIVQGMVHRLTAAGILEGPTHVLATFFDLNVRILTPGDTLIDVRNALFKPMLKLCEMLPNRLVEETQAGVGNKLVLLLPLLIIYQVVLEAAEADTLAAEDVSRL